MDDEFIRVGPETTGTTGTTGTDDIPSPERDRPPRTRDLKRMQQQLADAYTQVGVIIGIVGGRTGNLAGFIMARRADMLAESWIDLAERDPRVRRAINNILQVGGWSGVAAAHASVILPVAAMSGVLPEPVAEKIMLGLAMQDPELFTLLQAHAQSGQNGAGN